MDAVFDAHFRIIQDAFGRQGTRLGLAYAENGDVDYIYEEGFLLVARRDGNVDRFSPLLRSDAPDPEQHETFVRVALADLNDSFPSVPDALARLDGEFNAGVPRGAAPLLAPNHLWHVERLCSAIEPEVVTGTDQPFPPPRQGAEGEQAVGVALVDNGLVPDSPNAHPWLAGVQGEDDPVGPVLPDGQQLIEPFHGHGTFVAGVLRCQAPQADVWVGNELDTSGASLESKIVEKVTQVIQDRSPAIVNISSGTYTRNDWVPLGFETFLQAHPDVLFVAAAGNDNTDRPLYPAAFDGVLSVGALGPDQVHRAWFSNYGDTVNVYAIGEGHINAFTVGEYRYNEPPKRPAAQNFTVPLARWDGTSFSAPVVAGMIAARMGQTGENAKDARDALLAQAEDVPGLGKVLRV